MISEMNDVDENSLEIVRRANVNIKKFILN